ncbi:family 78 glycoside hydrolase catalytic domain [Paenibacillus sp. IB182496]|uniref:alpha-L-rhamnosidase n=1 Tax=Paenibacillus sabuli TaxID=2772509 RepID=A0A927GT83_9BACL|nr:alpha-L-rhamnosidase [Paenibacillus sabuli]MBD2846452.1 family 78 glycoside hydrolase catalytic domain [Paenibacillus sabuli]
MTLTVKALTCDYRSELLGTDASTPKLSWKLESDRRGTMQGAYRIRVTRADDPSAAGPLWDSGKVTSSQSLHIPYAGPPLEPRTRYAYEVKAWDEQGEESPWSASQWWETALLGEPWRAVWITPDPERIDPQGEPAFLLRRGFELKGPVWRARLYATAAGVYEAYVNGRRVGEEWMSPGWTSYNKRHQYQTYEVTDLLVSGPNALGLQLADGWYKGNLAWQDNRNLYGDRRAALLQLHVEHADGSETVIVSDEQWKSETGPIQYAEIYHGETYDARLERPGWSEAGYDDSAWCGTERLDLPYDPLTAQENWATRITERLRPIELLRTPSGETVLDMGQNMVGRIRMRVNAPAGTRIRLQHAEVLDREGNFYIGNLRKARQTVEYIARGSEQGEPESYAPYFTFQGFRYVKVEGYPGQERGADVPLDAFIGEVMHSDMPPTGEFECSHPLVNQLQRNIVWGQRGNFLDVPTDCPQRDERLGWTGDAQVFIRTAVFNYQIGPFFTKWLRDLRADQLPDGGVPHVIPSVIKGHSSAAWGDAATICPWEMYRAYGDTSLLEEQYDSMRAWVAYMRAQGESETLWNTGSHFGDWLGLDAKENSYVGATPRDLIATAFYAHSARLVRDAAVVLCKAEDVRTYGELHHRVVAAFRNEFVTPSGRLAAPTQTAHVLALMFELVEGEGRTRVARELNALVEANKDHLTTGFVGTPYLCLVLSAHGYHATAEKLLLQESYPSWLYSVVKGATTIWEHWDGIKEDGTFWSDAMNSYNHYAYGAIGDWMYRILAGLDMDDEAAEPAWRRLRIAPRLGEGALTHARASLETPYGRAVSAWRIEEGRVQLSAEVPPNATARILLPDARLEDVRESGAPLAETSGVTAVEQTAEGVLIDAGSGAYRFEYLRAISGGVD